MAVMIKCFRLARWRPAGVHNSDGDLWLLQRRPLSHHHTSNTPTPLPTHGALTVLTQRKPTVKRHKIPIMADTITTIELID
ncbi:hypothetical protein KIN20_015518 [Parelaphostrongylus tenuis]|uniref:Uncharacterized protein n=1 Tax=Parelaphostrongylus tenuis TaxID=148309 RepID=A0AAD5MYL4_PARTN|nr:hypothetical protein KIN20_015518 [Parelaphostrongylus tenuis]